MPKQIPLSEVKKHDKRNSVWMVIHDEVYDVTNFLAEHPGGADVLLEAAGKDSTQDFEDVGHSQDARDMMKKYRIGKVSKADRKEPPSPCTASGRSRSSTKSCKKSKASVSRRADSPYCDETSCTKLPKPPSTEKTWRTFDCENETRNKQKPKKRKLSLNKPHSAGQPCGRDYTKLKYAVLLLAGLIVVGIAVKKFKS